MSQAGMSREIGQSRWHAWWVNGGLLLLAVISLAPLAWMLSVSFMPGGQASQFPPPLLPSRITADNYRELFARTGMTGNFLNSLGMSLGITLGSLLLNTLQVQILFSTLLVVLVMVCLPLLKLKTKLVMKQIKFG